MEFLKASIADLATATAAIEIKIIARVNGKKIKAKKLKKGFYIACYEVATILY